MGNIEFTELQVVQGPNIEFTELEITSASTLGHIEFTELELSGTSAGAPLIFTTSVDAADAGQIVSLVGQGGAAPYVWAVVSMTNGIAAPTITPAGDTLTATIQAPPTLNGSTMVVGLTPAGAVQVQKTIEILPSTICLRIGGVETPCWMEVRV
jgi:hypothetical protein